jgi:hypothetical protein
MENKTKSEIDFIAYLRIYQTLLLNYLEKGVEEFITKQYKKKKESMYIEGFFISIEPMHYDNKVRIQQEVKRINEIISGYEKYTRSNV